jgi:serine/threonine-protein kinase SRPK3
MEWLDLHPRNVGVALPTLSNHPIKDILHYFGNPECIIVLPEKQPSEPQALPAYLVPPISIAEYLTDQDPTFDESSPRGVIMDLGNGQYFQSHDHGMI